MDIKPPARPPKRQPTQIAVPSRTADSEHRLPAPLPEPMLEAHVQSLRKKKIGKKRLIIGIISGLIALIVVAITLGYLWYQHALSPVSSDPNSARVAFTIESGTSPSDVGAALVEAEVIRDELAFAIYTRLSGTQDQLKAGSYRLSPAESTPEIIKHLVSGKVEAFTVMFYPGATLTDTTDTPENRKTDVTTVLKDAGYTDTEIKTALAKTYDHPVFAGKPATADLEGYVYGETYMFSDGATVEDILTRTFDELYKAIEQNDLVNKYKQHGLSLYEGITLASIIQREVPDASEQDRQDQKQVAQVFYKRLGIKMPLGSDVTYHYAADKMGVPRDHTLNSPYNTRKVVGLPPGPISAPGVSALIAAGNPASGDYLYFLSGDDDKTYFGKTDADHEQNISKHCHQKCQLP